LEDPQPFVQGPSDEALEWVASSIGPGTKVRTVRRLIGGITSAMHAISVVDGNGRHRRCVLRRWPNDDDHVRSDWVLREARILDRLGATAIPAPRLIDFDADGNECGERALLMSYLDGRVELTPADPDEWLVQIASVLARIHQTDVEAPVAESWLNRDRLKVPQWSRRPHLWREAFALMEEGPPSFESRFIHHDYQQFNLLWRKGRITGVVDWVWGSSGPPSMDVSHQRLNLSVLYSSELAERFLHHYEGISGHTVDRWWDVEGLLLYLPGWGKFLQQQAGRRLAVDYARMHERVEETLAAALHRA
jgi:aminoglycoside phosphotransferase (APT) family kinase protein